MSEHSQRPTVAVFRPDDERLARARFLLTDLGVEAVADPMLTVEPTGRQPRTDGAYTVLTSKTAADLLPADWRPGDLLCAIGPATADALENAGFAVDIVPETYSSEGLVERLTGDVESARVEVARSDHGSPTLLDGLAAAGAYVHETVLYRLTRPPDSGVSAVRAAAGDLDAALFTSSLTVEHFLDAARERGVADAARTGLETAVVGAIGEPTAETARDAGITVDIVPESAGFETLARAVVTRV
jgi:uroporphyrinogen-III synthase